MGRHLRGALAAVVTAVAAGAATLAGAATPAAAATPDGYGFAYLDKPSQPLGFVYVPDPAHQFTTTGGAVTVTRVGTGMYRVLFPGLANPGGVMHVTAVTDGANWCQLRTFGPSGPDEGALVACIRFGVGVADTPFAILFSASSAPPVAPGAYGYISSDATGAVLASYDSGAGAALVSHGAVGNYVARLTGVGAPSLAGNVQVTAVNNAQPAHCNVAAWGVAPTGLGVRVRCFDFAGAPLDSGWTLSYQRDRAISGGLAPPKQFGYFFDAAGAPVLTNGNSVLGPGTNTVAGGVLRMVTFPAVGLLADHVQVTAVSGGSVWCNLTSLWATSGGNALVRDVICRDGGTGNVVASNSLVTYTSRF